MTEWIALIPPGDTCTVQRADVAEAKIVEVSKLDAWARLEAARREYERLANELGQSVKLEGEVTWAQVARETELALPPALRVVDEEEHHAFKRPGPRFGCRCSYVFDTAAELKDHQTRCGVAARHRNLGGHAEPGGLKWGET